MMERKLAYPIGCILLILTLSFQTAFIQKRYQARIVNPACPWCEEKEGEDVIFLPLSPSVMRLFSPADPHFLADLLWLRTTYYFGEHTLSDKEYPYLFHLLDLITDLSPHWEIPYLFGAIILPSEADALEEGMYIMEKGMIHVPDSWELRFFKGYYLWKTYDDKIAAAEYLYKASIIPGAPAYLANLSATLATEEGERELAVRFVQQALKNIHDPAQKKILIKKLKKMTQEK